MAPLFQYSGAGAVSVYDGSLTGKVTNHFTVVGNNFQLSSFQQKLVGC